MFTDDPVAALLEEIYKTVLKDVFDVESVFVAVLIHEGRQRAAAWFVGAKGGEFEICVMGMSEWSTDIDVDALLSDVRISLSGYSKLFERFLLHARTTLKLNFRLSMWAGL